MVGLEHILIVEDNPKHVEDARAFFSSIPGLKVEYARTFSEAEKFLGGPWGCEEPTVQGVITDLYLPIGRDYIGKKGDEDPIGALIAARCQQKNLPFILCTAGYHHGVKYNWICMLQRELGWPEIIDGGQSRSASNEESSVKQWNQAYQALRQAAETPKQHTR